MNIISEELRLIHESIDTKDVELKPMTKKEKKQWILDYMKDPSHKHIFFDVVSSEFVLDYISECNPKKISATAYGTPKVPELGRYLGEMYREGLLWRYTLGCQWSQDGYPKWVYVYKLKDDFFC